MTQIDHSFPCFFLSLSFITNMKQIYWFGVGVYSRRLCNGRSGLNFQQSVFFSFFLVAWWGLTIMGRLMPHSRDLSIMNMSIGVLNMNDIFWMCNFFECISEQFQFHWNDSRCIKLSLARSSEEALLLHH